MAQRPIVTEPNSVLRAAAGEVPPEEITGAKIRRLILDMKETLAASLDGVGLAAPQVGELLKIFLVSEEAYYIDVENLETAENAKKVRKKWRHYVFVNPVMTKQSRKKTKLAEGCLSLPAKFGMVERAEKVSLTWFDENGKKESRGFTNFFARVIQHEMDHLGGKLISDRAKKIFDASKSDDQKR